eukprot:17751-Heterococcus_DN1.PRE.1
MHGANSAAKQKSSTKINSNNSNKAVVASSSSVVSADQEAIAKRAAKIREARDVERRQLRALIAARRREKDKHYAKQGGVGANAFDDYDDGQYDDDSIVIVTPS